MYVCMYLTLRLQDLKVYVCLYYACIRIYVYILCMYILCMYILCMYVYRGLDSAKYESAWSTLRSVQGVLIPGGFGIRGVHGDDITYNHTYIHIHTYIQYVHTHIHSYTYIHIYTYIH